MPVAGSGRLSHEPTVLTSSGVAFELRPRLRMPLDAGVDERRVEQVGIEDLGVGVAQVLLDLVPDLALDLGVRALLRDLAGERPGRVPIGDVDRQAVDGVAVAVVGGEVTLGPELRLGQRGQRPLRVHVGDVTRGDVDPLSQEELDARHPVRVEIVDPLELLVRAQELRREQLPDALGGHRRDEPVGVDLPSTAVGCRSRSRWRVAPSPSGSSAVTRWPMWKRHAELLQQTDPRLDPRLVGRPVEDAVDARRRCPGP